jgi:hypothetical protein
LLSLSNLNLPLTFPLDPFIYFPSPLSITLSKMEAQKVRAKVKTHVKGARLMAFACYA